MNTLNVLLKNIEIDINRIYSLTCKSNYIIKRYSKFDTSKMIPIDWTHEKSFYSVGISL